MSALVGEWLGTPCFGSPYITSGEQAGDDDLMVYDDVDLLPDHGELDFLDVDVIAELLRADNNAGTYADSNSNNSDDSNKSTASTSTTPFLASGASVSSAAVGSNTDSIIDVLNAINRSIHSPARLREHLPTSQKECLAAQHRQHLAPEEKELTLPQQSENLSPQQREHQGTHQEELLENQQREHLATQEREHVGSQQKEHLRTQQNEHLAAQQTEHLGTQPAEKLAPPRREQWLFEQREHRPAQQKEHLPPLQTEHQQIQQGENREVASGSGEKQHSSAIVTASTSSSSPPPPNISNNSITSEADAGAYSGCGAVATYHSRGLDATPASFPKDGNVPSLCVSAESTTRCCTNTKYTFPGLAFHHQSFRTVSMTPPVSPDAHDGMDCSDGTETDKEKGMTKDSCGRCEAFSQGIILAPTRTANPLTTSVSVLGRRECRGETGMKKVLPRCATSCSSLRSVVPASLLPPSPSLPRPSSSAPGFSILSKQGNRQHPLSLFTTNSCPTRIPAPNSVICHPHKIKISSPMSCYPSAATTSPSCPLPLSSKAAFLGTVSLTVPTSSRGSSSNEAFAFSVPTYPSPQSFMMNSNAATAWSSESIFARTPPTFAGMSEVVSHTPTSRSRVKPISSFSTATRVGGQCLSAFASAPPMGWFSRETLLTSKRATATALHDLTRRQASNERLLKSQRIEHVGKGRGRDEREDVGAPKAGEGLQKPGNPRTSLAQTNIAHSFLFGQLQPQLPEKPEKQRRAGREKRQQQEVENDTKKRKETEQQEKKCRLEQRERQLELTEKRQQGEYVRQQQEQRKIQKQEETRQREERERLQRIQRGKVLRVQLFHKQKLLKQKQQELNNVMQQLNQEQGKLQQQQVQHQLFQLGQQQRQKEQEQHEQIQRQHQHQQQQQGNRSTQQDSAKSATPRETKFNLTPQSLFQYPQYPNGTVFSMPSRKDDVGDGATEESGSAPKSAISRETPVTGHSSLVHDPHSSNSILLGLSPPQEDGGNSTEGPASSEQGLPAEGEMTETEDVLSLCCLPAVSPLSESSISPFHFQHGQEDNDGLYQFDGYRMAPAHVGSPDFFMEDSSCSNIPSDPDDSNLDSLLQIFKSVSHQESHQSLSDTCTVSDTGDGFDLMCDQSSLQLTIEDNLSSSSATSVSAGTGELSQGPSSAFNSHSPRSASASSVAATAGSTSATVHGDLTTHNSNNNNFTNDEAVSELIPSSQAEEQRKATPSTSPRQCRQIIPNYQTMTPWTNESMIMNEAFPLSTPDMPCLPLDEQALKEPKLSDQNTATSASRLAVSSAGATAITETVYSLSPTLPSMTLQSEICGLSSMKRQHSQEVGDSISHMTREKRFRKTADALQKCGLWDIAMKTGELIKRNVELQKQIERFRSEATVFLKAVVQNPENQELMDSLTAGAPLTLGNRVCITGDFEINKSITGSSKGNVSDSNSSTTSGYASYTECESKQSSPTRNQK